MSFLRVPFFAFLIFFSFGAEHLNGQQSLNQLIVASGGAFSDPTDFVSVAAYSPQNQSTSFIGEIKTQAVQDVLIDGGKMYITATDSLVVFDLETNQRINSVAISGARYATAYNDLLFVSIQYPETNNFLKVFDKNTLIQSASISEITGETASMVVHENKLYVAVPGDWTSTIGKLAVLNAINGTFIEEIDLSASGAGIHDVFIYNNKILSVNRSPWGGTSGTLTLFDPVTKLISHHIFPYHIGKGIGIHNHQLYLSINNGIGTIDLESWQVTDDELVSDPGSSSFIYFADIVLDTLNSQLFATTTDYFSMGEGLIFNLNGAQTGSFEAGISAEALALDYRTLSSLGGLEYSRLNIFPNPATTTIQIANNSDETFETIKVFDAHGQLVKLIGRELTKNSVDVSELGSGIYFIVITTEGSDVILTKFIKQ
jgi:hypothetical protein